ncbi:MAG: glycerol-3-phosphate 1-O-acyltransferase PlsY [Balneolaceae bacterium]
MISLVTVLIICYLIGSIPSSIWMGRLFRNVDIRDYGSGNAGATNTFRVLGWRSGVVVLILDFSKGLITTLVVSQLAWDIASGPVSPVMWDTESFLKISCGVMAVLGHMFPVFASFEGGKGAATAAGMLYGIEPISVTISVILFILTILFTRYVSLGSIMASLVYPFSQLLLNSHYNWEIDPSILIFSSVMAFGIIVKHHANIRRLLKGTENRVESFKPSNGILNKEGEKT